jgi:hypothetical protein
MTPNRRPRPRKRPARRRRRRVHQAQRSVVPREALVIASRVSSKFPCITLNPRLPRPCQRLATHRPPTRTVVTSSNPCGCVQRIAGTSQSKPRRTRSSPSTKLLDVDSTIAGASNGVDQPKVGRMARTTWDVRGGLQTATSRARIAAGGGWARHGAETMGDPLRARGEGNSRAEARKQKAARTLPSLCRHLIAERRVWARVVLPSPPSSYAATPLPCIQLGCASTSPTTHPEEASVRSRRHRRSSAPGTCKGKPENRLLLREEERRRSGR